MESNKEYFVFISYSSLDNKWAIWLRHELEHYHLPVSFNGRTDVRDNLRIARQMLFLRKPVYHKQYVLIEPMRCQK